MARPIKHDGSLFRRKESKFWWMQYRDKSGQRQKESTGAQNWDDAQKILRARLGNRDNNTLLSLRKAREITLGEWANSYLENFSKPPFRAQKTHEINQRALRHLNAMFERTKLAELTASEIEMYLRNRLKQRVMVKTKGGPRSKRLVESNHGTSGTSCPAAHAERSGSQEAARRESLLRCGVPDKSRRAFRPHYMGWSEQQKIDSNAPEYLKNVIQIITEAGLRIYKELAPMKKEHTDLKNGTVWIPDSKTPNAVAEVPLTDMAMEVFGPQLAISGPGPFLVPGKGPQAGYQKPFKTAWRATLRRANVPYFRIYDLRSTYATRLSAGGVADEFVTQLLRQGDAKVFKKYSQMKLQMKREALGKLNRSANEGGNGSGTAQPV